MSFFAISALINALTSIVLGSVIAVKRSDKNTTTGFILFCITVTVWSLGYFFWQISDNAQDALFWSRVLMAGAIFSPVAYLQFALAFLGKKSKKLIVSSYIIFSIFFLLNFTNLFIQGIKSVPGFEFWPEPGVAYHPFLVIWLGYFVVIFYYLIKEYLKEKGLKKIQLKYVILAVIVAVFGGSTNYFLWYDINIPPYGNFLVGLYVVLTFYAIIRYRLLDIKLVLRKSSVVMASLLVVFPGAAAAKILTEKFFPIFRFWTDLLVVAAAVFIYPYLRDYFFKLANQYFFSSLYDSRKVILNTTNKIKTYLETEKIYQFLDETFQDIFHTRKFGVLDYNGEEDAYQISYNQGFKLGKKKKFARNPALEKLFIQKNQCIILEEVKELHYNKDTKETIDLMDKMGVELLVPLNIKKRTVGLLALGPKETKEMYNDEDLQVLEIVGGQAAVSIENAQLYSEARNFNKRLRKKVKEATFDLKKTNKELRGSNRRLSEAYKKLRQLDEAKNEFISIASHQLRTPLTSIKGFISMIFEGDYGKYSDSVGEALKKIYISNDRLIKLVNDLLNISRIETGRFTFHFGKNNLPNMVSKIVEGFELEAKNKNLKLVYNKPEDEIEEFVFDKEKIQEVTSNLIDNAIKYTQEGEVKVDLKDYAKKAQVVVSDSGRGMARDELEAVFEKFHRGDKSASVDTEGTGLGLYVCEKIVNAHKGKIWAESDGIGRGSRFIVELPKNLEPEDKQNEKKPLKNKLEK
ncbi:MAG: ATP-binding protein [Candidatus Moraniibacteriota bacterium]